MDGIFHVCRAFEDPDVIHVEDRVDPVADLDIIHAELRAKDVAMVSAFVDVSAWGGAGCWMGARWLVVVGWCHYSF